MSLVEALQAQPAERLRRFRRTAGLRDLVRETRVSVRDLIYPLFVVPGRGIVEDLDAMPGQQRFSVDTLAHEVETVAGLRVPAVLLFGVPEEKDEAGSGAYDPDGIMPQAIQAIRRAAPDLVIITDVCLCSYTTHGHCGVVREGQVDNDASLELLARTAVAHAAAGADIVAPSAMMDGQVAALRAALDTDGFTDTAVLSYAAKFASAFYGPFREAAESAPQFGDRRGYQLPPSNAREALRELARDVAEGADALIVKPALPYLDILHQARQRWDHPLAAYQVSGEYAALKAAAANGWLDGDRAMDETLTAIKRAGADFIITYFAKEFARKEHDE